MLSWKTWSVVRRHRDVYLKTWKTAIVPPLAEPLIYLFAFGFGLGAFVRTLQWQGQEVSYLFYISAGILANTVFNNSFFECLYATYVRMFYQKTFDAILATRVEIRHIIRAEMLWGSLRASFQACWVLVTLLGLRFFGWIDFSLSGLPVIFFFTLLAGVLFSALALLFTATVPAIDHFNYPTFLLGIPLTLTSNTFFPIDGLHPALYCLSQVNPLYHLVEIIRFEMAFAAIPPNLFSSLAVFALWGLLLVPLAERWMAERILGEDRSGNALPPV